MHAQAKEDFLPSSSEIVERWSGPMGGTSWEKTNLGWILTTCRAAARVEQEGGGGRSAKIRGWTGKEETVEREPRGGTRWKARGWGRSSMGGKTGDGVLLFWL